MTRGCIRSRVKNILPGKVQLYGTQHVTRFDVYHLTFCMMSHQE